MTTTNKNFKVKNGLEVLGTSATVDGNDVLTTASSVDDLADVSTTGAVEGQALVFDASLNLIPGTVSGGGGGASGVITSDTKPSPATDGLEWHDTTDGNDYISVDGVWVGRAAPASVSSAVDIRLTTAETNITDLEQQVRPVILGGTGATTAAGARVNLDAAQTAHVHAASDISSGQLVHDRMPTGAILQVVQAVKTNTYSQNSNTFTDIPGYSVSITPKFATSKILFMSQTNVAVANGYNVHLRMMRNSTPINVGDASGGRPQSSWQGFYNTTEELDTVTLQYLDSPATTAAITYKVQIKSGVECRINYTIADRDNGSGTYDARVASTLIVMEIAG